MAFDKYRNDNIVIELKKLDNVVDVGNYINNITQELINLPIIDYKEEDLNSLFKACNETHNSNIATYLKGYKPNGYICKILEKYIKCAKKLVCKMIEDIRSYKYNENDNEFKKYPSLDNIIDKSNILSSSTTYSENLNANYYLHLCILQFLKNYKNILLFNNNKYKGQNPLYIELNNCILSSYDEKINSESKIITEENARLEKEGIERNRINTLIREKFQNSNFIEEFKIENIKKLNCDQINEKTEFVNFLKDYDESFIYLYKNSNHSNLLNIFNNNSNITKKDVIDKIVNEKFSFIQRTWNISGDPCNAEKYRSAINNFANVCINTRNELSQYNWEAIKGGYHRKKSRSRSRSKSKSKSKRKNKSKK